MGLGESVHGIIVCHGRGQDWGREQGGVYSRGMGTPHVGRHGHVVHRHVVTHSTTSEIKIETVSDS